MVSPKLVSVLTVGFVGLDDLSLHAALSLVRCGYIVQAFEKSDSIINGILKVGGIRCSSPKDAARDVSALVVQIPHVDEASDVFFGNEGALKGLNKDAIIILRSTISPSLVRKLEKDITEIHGMTCIVDAYMCRGRSEGLDGKVIIASSGTPDSLARARPILSAMCEKLFTFEGEVGGGSKVKLVAEMLEGIHLNASVEAQCLGVKAGIHPWIVYEIICNAAGLSSVFKNNVPQLIKGELKHQILNALVKEMDIILDTAQSLAFPLPLLSAANQQVTLGLSHVDGDDEHAALIKIWEKVYGVDITGAANEQVYSPEQLATRFTTSSKSGRWVGFIGLGSMGFGMATHLLNSNFCVVGYDVYKPTLTRFANAGGSIGNSPAEASKGK